MARRPNARDDSSISAPPEEDGGPCWLCERPLGETVERHHPVPKSRKGKGTVPIHPICHRTLHAEFTNGELARIGDSPATLRNDERLQPFLHWIVGKPPDFNAPVRRKR